MHSTWNDQRRPSKQRTDADNCTLYIYDREITAPRSTSNNGLTTQHDNPRCTLRTSTLYVHSKELYISSNSSMTMTIRKNILLIKRKYKLQVKVITVRQIRNILSWEGLSRKSRYKCDKYPGKY